MVNVSDNSRTHTTMKFTFKLTISLNKYQKIISVDTTMKQIATYKI